MNETPKNLWKSTDLSEYQLHVTIPTIDSTIESENVDERVVYIKDLEKRKQAYGICGEYFLNEIKSHLQIYLNDIVQCFDLSSFKFDLDTSYTAQSTSANPISECLDCEIK
ncbi:unnamed protein product [Rhizophagus irregularis]|nr:unnamed protein product [Rhizophagus irregularis]CAB4474505.1 unnamed protein product [Rhizophagus irregularis]CAB5366304.1 unnamed protein product [Rhizophagus irregularis]